MSCKQCGGGGGYKAPCHGGVSWVQCPQCCGTPEPAVIVKPTVCNAATCAVIKAAVYREGGSAFDYSALTVEARGDDRWAVRRDGCDCLSVSGTWDHEPMPSSRTDEWLAAHRFSYDEAMARAVAMVEADPNYLAR